ncbi:MAG: glycosyltransferase family 4 protein [Candidatus Bathyarchaeia archaeon]
MSGDTGYSVRIYSLAKWLAKLGNEVSVIIPGFDTTVSKMDHFVVYKIPAFLPKTVLNLLAKLLRIAKSTALVFYDPLFVFRIRKLIHSADIVQIEQPTAGGFLVLIIAKILKKSVVVDSHDVFQALRVEYTSKIRRILETFIEVIVYKYASLILTVSEKEKAILASLGIPDEKINVTPNGVDIERFVISDMNFANFKRKYGLENYRVVVFVGNMEYSPNMEAVRLIATKIAPLVCKEFDNVKFLIVGRYIEKINSPYLIFTGTVKDIIEPLAIAELAIAPLFRGSGTRLKILEYLAYGLPVISTTKGVEGLKLENGACLIIEDEITEFARSIIQLLTNSDITKRLRKNAKEFIMNYDWEKISVQLHETYEEFLRKKSAC